MAEGYRDRGGNNEIAQKMGDEEATFPCNI